MCAPLLVRMGTPPPTPAAGVIRDVRPGPANPGQAGCQASVSGLVLVIVVAVLGVPMTVMEVVQMVAVLHSVVAVAGSVFVLGDRVMRLVCAVVGHDVFFLGRDARSTSSPCGRVYEHGDYWRRKCPKFPNGRGQPALRPVAHRSSERRRRSPAPAGGYASEATSSVGLSLRSSSGGALRKRRVIARR